MMSVALKDNRISVADYLAGEKISAVRHEYVDGRVFAMAGASKRHNRIIQNISAHLRERIIAVGCDLFVESVKVRADERTFYYPDVVITCEQNDDEEYVVYQPLIVFEVISPHSERTDRQEKLQIYRKIQSLKEYLIVWQDRILIERHYRTSFNAWEMQVFDRLDEEMEISEPSRKMPVADIYRNIGF